MNFKEAQSYLDSFINIEKCLQNAPKNSFKLERIKALLEALGDPQKKYKVVHVAGSKGKGSTCAMAAQILKEAGYKVGLYTSPHILHLRERLRILDQSRFFSSSQEIFEDCISEETFAQFLCTLKPVIETFRQTAFGALTYFEVMTAMAFYYFGSEHIDVAVVETGLGGRLDATNVTEAEVSVITSINFEHTQILGNTLTQIAQEKCAIIKGSTKKVVLANQVEEVKQVLEFRIKQFNLKPLVVGYNLSAEIKENSLSGQTFDLKTKAFLYSGLTMSLLGDHQLVNAAVAVGIAESLNELGMKISSAAIFAGLRNVQWPLRFEIIQHNPVMILDGAHNPASLEALCKTIKRLFPDKNMTVVFGISDDKNMEEMGKVLNKSAREIILTTCYHARAHRFRQADFKHFGNIKNIILTGTVQEACEQIGKSQRDNEVIVFCGSLFMVSEARALLVHPQPVHL